MENLEVLSNDLTQQFVEGNSYIIDEIINYSVRYSPNWKLYSTFNHKEYRGENVLENYGSVHSWTLILSNSDYTLLFLCTRYEGNQQWYFDCLFNSSTRKMQDELAKRTEITNYEELLEKIDELLSQNNEEGVKDLTANLSEVEQLELKTKFQTLYHYDLEASYLTDEEVIKTLHLNKIKKVGKS